MIRTDSWLDDVTEAHVAEAVDCGFVVHQAIGPGYMEPLYSRAMCIELEFRGIPYKCERVFPVTYRERAIGTHRLDLVIRDCIVVELKAVKALEPVHRAH